MRVFDQTLEEILESLSPLDVEWMDETAANTIARLKALWPCHSSTPKSASKLSVIVTHGIFSQPIRAFRRAMSACGAREAYTRVVSRAFRWTRLLT